MQTMCLVTSQNVPWYEFKWSNCNNLWHRKNYVLKPEIETEYPINTHAITKCKTNCVVFNGIQIHPKIQNFGVWEKQENYVVFLGFSWEINLCEFLVMWILCFLAFCMSRGTQNWIFLGFYCLWCQASHF